MGKTNAYDQKLTHSLKHAPHQAQAAGKSGAASKGTIAIVSETYRPEVNGVANTLGYWVDGLIALGYDIQIFRPKQNSQDLGSQNARERQVTTVGLPIPRYPELKFGLPSASLFKKYWNNSKPAAVYVATEGPLGWSASKVARSMGIRVISGFHTNFQQYSQFYGFGWLEKLIMAYLRNFHNHTRSTLVPTKTQADYLEKHGFNNVSILSRGVDCDLYSPSKRDEQLRAKWGVVGNNPVCLYVGRLASEKNVEVLIDAYKRLEKSHPETKFVFVGDGPARAELEAGCPKAIFAGMQRGEALAAHYASGDIFLFPSKTDTFGNVVTEAMASGLAVVAFNDAAPKEHLEHRVSGLMADLANDSEYLDLVEEIAGDHQLLATIRTNSLALAKAISWSEIVDRFESFLIETSQPKNSALTSPQTGHERDISRAPNAGPAANEMAQQARETA